MGVEWIKRITVKKGEVYLCSKSDNDGLPFHSWKSDDLTNVYQKEGQTGLDRELLEMFYEYCSPKGNHQSIKRYIYVLNHQDSSKLYNAYLDQSYAAYAKLSNEDKDSLWHEPTSNAMRYRKYEQKTKKDAFNKMADICKEYDDLIKNSDIKENWESIHQLIDEYNKTVMPSKKMTVVDFKKWMDQCGSYESTYHALDEEIRETIMKKAKLEKIDLLMEAYNSVISDEEKLDFYDIKDNLDSLDSYDEAILELQTILKDKSKNKEKGYEGR